MTDSKAKTKGTEIKKTLAIHVFGDGVHRIRKEKQLTKCAKLIFSDLGPDLVNIPCISARDMTKMDDIKTLGDMSLICGADPKFRAIVNMTKFWKRFDILMKTKPLVIGVFCHHGQHRSFAAALAIQEKLTEYEIIINLMDRKRWSQEAQDNARIHYDF